MLIEIPRGYEIELGNVRIADLLKGKARTACWIGPEPLVVDPFQGAVPCWLPHDMVMWPDTLTGTRPQLRRNTLSKGAIPRIGTTEGSMTLQTERFDFATQTRVCDAFKRSKIYRGLDVHHIHAVYEHGQWWIKAVLNEGNDPDELTFSVVDAEGGDSVNGFDFEEV